MQRRVERTKKKGGSKSGASFSKVRKRKNPTSLPLQFHLSHVFASCWNRRPPPSEREGEAPPVFLLSFSLRSNFFLSRIAKTFGFLRPLKKKINSKKKETKKNVFFFFRLKISLLLKLRGQGGDSHVQGGCKPDAFLWVLTLSHRGRLSSSTLALCKHTHTHAHPYSTFSDFISSHLSSYDPKKRGSLRDGERVVDALGVDLGALEPALVADRDVGDVEVAAGDSGGDEVVAGERERFFFLLGKVSFLPFFRFRASSLSFKKKKKKKKKKTHRPPSLPSAVRVSSSYL